MKGRSCEKCELKWSGVKTNSAEWWTWGSRALLRCWEPLFRRALFSLPKPCLNPWSHKHMSPFCLLGSFKVIYFVTMGTSIFVGKWVCKKCLLNKWLCPLFVAGETKEKSCDQRTTLPLLFLWVCSGYEQLWYNKGVESRRFCAVRHTKKKEKLTFCMEQCSKKIEVL